MLRIDAGLLQIIFEENLNTGSKITMNQYTFPLFTITLIRPSIASASPIIFKSWETDRVSRKSELCDICSFLKQEGSMYLHRHCFPDCN